MTKDVLLSLLAGILCAVVAFLITVNVLDWLWFRDVPEDATRGITENIYGAPIGLAAGLLVTLVTFALRRRRQQV